MSRSAAIIAVFLTVQRPRCSLRGQHNDAGNSYMNTCAYRAIFRVFCLSTFGLFCGIALGEDEKLAIGLDGKICTFEEAIYALHGYESQFVNDTTFPAKLTLEQLRQGEVVRLSGTTRSLISSVS